MPPKDIGARVAQVRERRSMTQETLAKRAGINRVTLADIERGASQPTLATLARLAKALRVSLGEIVK